MSLFLLNVLRPFKTLLFQLPWTYGLRAEPTRKRETELIQ